MSLRVVVKSANSLPNVEILSKSDPFTIINYRGQKKRTKVIDNNLDPKWNETLTWDVPGGIAAGECLLVEVYDHETVGKNRLLGSTKVFLRDVLSGGKTNTDVNKNLTGKAGEQLAATIALEVNYEPPPKDVQEEKDESLLGGGEHCEMSISANSSESVAGSSRSTKGNHHEDIQRVHVQQTRHKLPNKPIDFQVRVHVIEARKLVGSSLNTVVKVACGNDIQQTSTEIGTSNPVFDEVIFFNFRERPEQMFDRVTELKVYNARKVIADALIGSFKFDLGLVYDEVEHCYIHKWLLLTDPSDSSGGTKGYLKISIQVLGPGDNPRRSPSQTEVNQDKVDIEANLLRPSGVRLVPATLTVRVFRGEDLPQMDPGYFEGVKKILHIGSVQKELVDPYCTVTFAGHKGKTQVIWNERDPAWNKQINLGVRFPSMCERIRFRLKDKDKVNQDDYIGTCYLHMSEISCPGENGFPPTFGPCFINCYGSPREFTELPDKYDHLNKGMLEGVAYRGRVMVEVAMSMGKLPTETTEDIKTYELNRLTPFLRRRKFKLFGTFYSATMVFPNDQPVEFEVSIGNYGNKLDENTPAQSSTTHPSNPVYDGTNYFYIPWIQKKPVIQIDSLWEDCSYRIQSLNLLLFTRESLIKGLDSVKAMMKIENYQDEAVKECLKNVLDSFSEHLYQTLPSLPRQGTTQLDKMTREQRVQSLSALRKDCDSLRRNFYTYSLRDIMTEVEQYIVHLKSMAYEPQNSIPDVVIWMLSKNKRVAVKRIPSHELMYSAVGKFRGKNCGKIQTINLLPPAVEKEEELMEFKDKAQVRLALWLGLEEDQQNWSECCSSGDLTVLAETYENQTRLLLGNWSTKSHWSDASGKLKQPREAFDPPPPGWDWDSDWEIKPEQSIDFEPEQGRNEWTEEIFENQSRQPLSYWPDETSSFWTDADGTDLVRNDGKEQRKITRDEVLPPNGWVFRDTDMWKVDTNRAVDEEGWEYTIEHGMAQSYVPFERNIHLSRRRRWIRTRFRDSDSKAIQKHKEKHSKAIMEGWEYASLGSSSFHIPAGCFDLVRRRRYVRKLIKVEPRAGRAVFKPSSAKTKKGDKKKKKEDGEDHDECEGKQLVPRMYLHFKEPQKYQLRAYLYQARDMYSSDNTGLSDPYAIMSFEHYSTRSIVVKKSLCPTWDQTLIVSQTELFGDRNSVKDSPPPVVLEFYDEDQLGKDEFLGSSTVIPTVRLKIDKPSPRLDWVEIVRYNRAAGEVLVACELLLIEGSELPPNPPGQPSHYLVPADIRPKLQKTRVDILCWGVRDMRQFQLLSVASPMVEVECSGYVQRSEHIKDAKKNPNFTRNIISFEVDLPIEEIYCPPLNFRIFDKRMFGHQPMVGTHIVKSLKDFFETPTPISSEADTPSSEALPQQPESSVSGENGEISIHIDTGKVTHTTGVMSGDQPPEHPAEANLACESYNSDPDSVEKFDFDWWSKYYCSVGDERRTQNDYRDGGYDTVVVYNHELEEQFDRFADFVQTFALFRGKGSRDPEDRSGEPVGYFKGSLKVYPVLDDGSTLPKPSMSFGPMATAAASDPVEIIVRVYVIKGIDLQPRDPDGKSDPYIKVKIGQKEINDRDGYIPSNLNPIFGKMFELPATLPLDHTLTVSVMDWDRVSADDLIGETKIDLENRFLSRHRAKCGLPKSYSIRGPNKWRDSSQPLDILNEWITDKGYAPAEWAEDKMSVNINGKRYSLDDFESTNKLHPDLSEHTDQRLALHVLRQQNLVPEHIETRNLNTAMHPGISQGQLHMWVDIFKKEGIIPPPVNVSPRTPEKYVLRIVVRNTKVSVDTSTDIYVKGWLRGENETQKTDIHYRSMDGEGNFNWRLIYPLEYLPTENVMVVKRKEHFYSLTKYECHVPPILTMQVWDNDIFTPDDFIGTIDFNLSFMPLPVKRSRNCRISQIPDGKSNVKTENLFKRKRMEGWWPIYESQTKKGKTKLKIKGKLELEFEIVTEEQSQLHPAAKARDEPNQNPKLDPPNRPKTSFFWLSSPWKSFRFVIWKDYKGRIIGLILLLLLLLPIIALVI